MRAHLAHRELLKRGNQQDLELQPGFNMFQLLNCDSLSTDKIENIETDARTEGPLPNLRRLGILQASKNLEQPLNSPCLVDVQRLPHFKKIAWRKFTVGNGIK